VSLLFLNEPPNRPNHNGFHGRNDTGDTTMRQSALWAKA
jgi:hypothetical protein